MPLGEELELLLLLLLLALEELLPVDVVEPLPALGCRPVELEEELLPVVVVDEDAEEELLPAAEVSNSKIGAPPSGPSSIQARR